MVVKTEANSVNNGVCLSSFLHLKDLLELLFKDQQMFMKKCCDNVIDDRIEMFYDILEMISDTVKHTLCLYPRARRLLG